MDLNPPNVRHSHKHVKSRLGPKTYIMIIDIDIKHSITLCYKAELTIDDLMTTRNKGLFGKPK